METKNGTFRGTFINRNKMQNNAMILFNMLVFCIEKPPNLTSSLI